MNEKNELVLTGRGRNGEFRVELTELWVGNIETEIAILSRRIGGAPSIRIRGSFEDLEKYLNSIMEAVKRAKGEALRAPKGTIVTINSRGDIIL
jgi:hypothetical protein